MNEIIGDSVELKTVSNYFFKNFSNHVQKNNQLITIWMNHIVLLGLEIITIVDNLKWDGQYPKSIQVLVMSISLDKQYLSLMMILI